MDIDASEPELPPPTRRKNAELTELALENAGSALVSRLRANLATGRPISRIGVPTL